MVCFGNVIFEIAYKYCILDSFVDYDYDVDYDSYSISYNKPAHSSRYNGHLS